MMLLVLSVGRGCSTTVELCQESCGLSVCPSLHPLTHHFPRQFSEPSLVLVSLCWVGFGHSHPGSSVKALLFPMGFSQLMIRDLWVPSQDTWLIIRLSVWGA